MINKSLFAQVSVLACQLGYPAQNRWFYKILELFLFLCDRINFLPLRLCAANHNPMLLKYPKILRKRYFTIFITVNLNSRINVYNP